MESQFKEIIIFVCVLFTFIVFGTALKSLDLNLTGNVISNNEVEETPEQVQMLSHEMKYNSYGNLIVSGVIGNIVDKDLGYVEIKIKFYDKEGNVLRTSSESIADLKKGEKWRFESAYPSFDTSNVIDYELSIGQVW